MFYYIQSCLAPPPGAPRLRLISRPKVTATIVVSWWKDSHSWSEPIE